VRGKGIISYSTRSCSALPALPGANRQKDGIGGIAWSAALIQTARVRYGVLSGDDLHRNLALRWEVADSHDLPDIHESTVLAKGRSCGLPFFLAGCQFPLAFGGVGPLGLGWRTGHEAYSGEEGIQ
jgi:hypothetical protein